MSTRQALVGGLTAVVPPTTVMSSTSSASTVRPAPPLAQAPRSMPLEARSILRRQTAGAGTPAATTKTSAKTTASSQVVAARDGRYRVASGDTLWTIARRFGVSVDAIAVASGLASPHTLRIGQVLVLPSGAQTGTAAAPARARSAAASSGRSVSVPYRVQSGDTLYAVARRYGVTVGAIVAANGLPSAHRLQIGQRLTVPAASGGGTAPSADLSDTRAAPALSATVRGFIWPARGLLTSRYGWRHRRHHDGIDLAAPRGAPIYAARDGRVVFAGWYYGYGRTVILSHGDGMTTLYGHASTLLVRTGETVRRGDVIARVGCSGQCTGFHVHFEVRVNGRAVNPLRYLN
ncbi:MAG: peptidoglycan DD-metalloendopeptidase family protein [Armatimonadetes bacterium]|nr:peptidoglycan DD-metalloendopeptidase family protein [Armatimonadota bacterium]